VSRARRAVPPRRVSAARATIGAAVAGLVLALALATGLPGPVVAADPTPTAGAGGDPRSAGEGPGLVGDPLLAIGGVVVVGFGSVVLTVVYVRLSRGRHR
jgi:hypothetical protein